MDNVTNVAGTNAATSAQINATTLTPDALLAYCSASLNELDDQIKQRMSDQQASVERQKAAGEVIGQFETFGQGITDGMKPDERRTMAEGLIDKYNKTDDPALQGLIKKAYTAVTGNEMKCEANGNATVYPGGTLPMTGKAPVMTAEAWNAAFTAPAKQAQDNMSKGSDIAMVEIQSLVSKRQLSIQLTTQMMQAANDGTKGIVGNVGH